jgi:CDP-diglyceride synthetase
VLVLLIGLAVLVAARPLYGVIATSRRPDFWQNVLVTMPLLLGPALTDNPGGDGVVKAMLIRLSGFIALALYAAVMTNVLAGWQHRRAVSAG